MKFEVVIVGGGFAGAYCARTLARELGEGSESRVALVSEDNVFTFQPMLPEVAIADVICGVTLSVRTASLNETVTVLLATV